MGCAVSVHVRQGQRNQAVRPTDDSSTKGTISTQLGISEEPYQPGDSVICFTYRKLVKATKNFSKDYVLGEGGFGVVFKGWLEIQHSTSTTPVAIKRLQKDCIQGHKEWQSEIFVLGQLRHENLVTLYGYCSEYKEKFLVYEFLPMGSLDYHLFPADKDGNPTSSSLSFNMRLKISLDMARGLAYLHENRLVHRDFKISNVLLDEKFNAKLADFGLARVVNSSTSRASTTVMGTLGYLDPEYYETGRLNVKSDVYAFGVMLLELLTGRQAMDTATKRPLVLWAEPFLDLRVPDMDSLIDPVIVSQLNAPSSLMVAAELAVTARCCTLKSAKSRPTMKEVLETLEDLVRRLDLCLDSVME